MKDSFFIMKRFERWKNKNNGSRQDNNLGGLFERQVFFEVKNKLRGCSNVI